MKKNIELNIDWYKPIKLSWVDINGNDREIILPHRYLKALLDYEDTYVWDNINRSYVQEERRINARNKKTNA